MSGYQNKNGIWNLVTPYGKKSGVWTKAKEGWVKNSGVWKQWWLQGGLVNNKANYLYNAGHFGSSTSIIGVASTSNRVFLGGWFNSYNGTPINCFVSIGRGGSGADGKIGSRDANFITNIGSGFNNSVWDIKIQSDGKILVSGAFTTFNGTTVNRLVRLNSDGTRDTTFSTNLGSGFNDTALCIFIQSDGKILLGGAFTTFNGTTVNRLVRLNSDGTRDTAFTTNLGTSFDNTLRGISVQSDGKILIAGDFLTFNGTTVNRLVRLNSDGTRDTAFTTNLGTSANNYTQETEIQSDGKILVVGGFSTFNGTSAGKIVRLNSDGTIDTAFMTNLGAGNTSGSDISAVKVQSDGKILVGGLFTTFSGTSIGRVIRLNSNGTIDTNFVNNLSPGFNGGSVNNINIQSDGKILVVGSFQQVKNIQMPGVARLNSDGTFDNAFLESGFDGQIKSIKIQSDGKILVGSSIASTFNNNTLGNYSTAGLFTRLNDDGTLDTAFANNIGIVTNSSESIDIDANNQILTHSQSVLKRFNFDGTSDTGFTTNLGTGFNSIIYKVKNQSDGKILVGGSFTTFNGASAPYLVRLNSDGTRDTAFTTAGGTGLSGFRVLDIGIQSDNKIIIAGFFTSFNGTSSANLLRLNSDGSLDTSFTTNIGSSANSIIYSVKIQSDGKILLGGSFTTFNGASVNYLVRLNSDGTRDTTFSTNLGSGFSSNVFAINTQSDGKILVGGNFTTFNGVTVNRIVRLNSDGTRDTAFTTNAGSGFTTNDIVVNVYSIEIASDNKIVVGGDFQYFNNNLAKNIVRLNSNGSIDTTFATTPFTGLYGIVFWAESHTNNSTLIGGNLSYYYNTALYKFAKINSDGSLNTTFMSNLGTGFNSNVFIIKTLSDESILVGGTFNNYNKEYAGGIIKLNSDGTKNQLFSAATGSGANGTIYTIENQQDNKILLGGSFTTFGGITANRLVRLNPNGTLDMNFLNNLGTGFDNTIESISVQSDGKILVSGDFSTFNGTTVNRIVRLNSDGTRDTAFTTNTGTGAGAFIRSICTQSDGKILLGGDFGAFNGLSAPYIVRLNSDGTRDTVFMTNLGTGFNNRIQSIVVQSDGKILAGGEFSTFNGITVNCIVRLNSDGTRDTAFTTNAGIGFTGYEQFSYNKVYSLKIRNNNKILVGGEFFGFNKTSAIGFTEIGGD